MSRLFTFSATRQRDPGREINTDALSRLITSAYDDIKRRIENERH